MLPGERELYRRFAAYDDEELLRILTAERAKYRGEALAAAEMVLTQRGVAPPTLFPTPGPPTAAGTATRPKNPYQLTHFAFDVLLLCLVCWGVGKLWAWTIATSLGVWSQLVFYVLAAQLLGSAAALRRKWRAKKWKI
ncbi:MAG: hypothetical protein ACJ74T_06350 [Pyrinomonadaceae bacterium]